MNLDILSEKASNEVEYSDSQSSFNPVFTDENTLSTFNNDDITDMQTIN